MNVDVIVNAANASLQMGGGVCGAIFRAAGERELQAACDKVAPIHTGDAVITPGFGLNAKYVIHTAGPVYRHGDKERNETFLRSCYTNSLRLAAENGCESIAFPLISSGIYGYPKEEALAVATSAIMDWLKDGELDVYLAVFDKEAFTVSENLLGGVKRSIDEPDVAEHTLDTSPPRA
jgi:O-acetyl-ADP-ribose deacetylase (regulator of RNase III)